VKQLTREQVESRKEKAVRFVRDVLNDPERADEIADEDTDSYAERRHIEIANARRRTVVLRTKADLEQEIDELRQENEDLQERLDTIADLVTPEDKEDEDEVEDEDSDAEAEE